MSIVKNRESHYVTALDVYVYTTPSQMSHTCGNI